MRVIAVNTFSLKHMFWDLIPLLIPFDNNWYLSINFKWCFIFNENYTWPAIPLKHIIYYKTSNIIYFLFIFFFFFFLFQEKSVNNPKNMMSGVIGPETRHYIVNLHIINLSESWLCYILVLNFIDLQEDLIFAEAVMNLLDFFSY